ncbi:LRP2 [Mytilus edulis]|uniref:LRP2 n=1 Tax=Mytilus edulis TaxID=6550 RepID=A0A8S3UBL6_MYTED|nr:LRP2 [Mytilus edulis]
MYVKVVLAILCLTVVSVVTDEHGTRSIQDCTLWIADDSFTSCYLCLPCSDGSGFHGYICRTSFCDGKEDCNNGEDEDGSLCQTEPCANTQWRCSDDKQCIHSFARCDGRTDCLDGSDEDHNACRAQQCSAGELKCANKLVASMRMDFVTVTVIATTIQTRRNVQCPDNKWKCDDRQQCIIRKSVCDGHNDCHDGSDETLETCLDYTCSSGKWKCKDNDKCIYDELVCDGNYDCTDKSEENEAVCRDYQCLGDKTKCADGLQCVSQTDACMCMLPGCKDGSGCAGLSSLCAYPVCYIQLYRNRPGSLMLGPAGPPGSQACP